MEIKLNFTDLVTSKNIDELLTDEESAHIGQLVVQDYQRDKDSRSHWEDTYEAANELALLIKKTKTFPWQGASNVKFPLLTIAALQFSARAYPALVNPPEVVNCKVVGKDDGTKAGRASRISQHMSYQLIEEDEAWEEEHDRLIMVLPICGTAFKKTFYDSDAKHNKSQLILAKDLVVNYWATSLDSAECITHMFELSAREVIERARLGTYTDKDYSPAKAPEHDDQKRRDLIQPMGGAPHQMLEQHCYIDLDGDGYPEPYIVTCTSDAKVARIVNRFGEVVRRKGQIAKIEADNFFTKYSFIPSVDGGFYDLGFGALLGPVNESVNTLINQLVDAGSLQNMPIGFIGRGGRVPGGAMRFQPGEFKRANVTGAALRDAIVRLDINAPSPVLFQMLDLLINYGQKLSSVTDVMSGESPGQNTPAYTSQQMLQQGLQVFAGVFKRCYRAQRDEFRKLYLLNRKYLTASRYTEVLDEGSLEDYKGDPKDIRPAADPNAVIEEDRLRKASAIAERAMSVPGYDTAKIELRFLESMNIPDYQELFPLDEQGKPLIEPPKDPEIMLKVAEEERRTKEGEDRNESNMADLQIKALLAEAQIDEIESRTVLNYAKAGSEDGKLDVAAEKNSIARFKEKREAIRDIVDGYQKLAGESSNGAGKEAASSSD